MRTFEWSEVEEYLNNNLDKEFDYGRTYRSKDCACLMSSFFNDKGIDFEGVSFAGFQAFSYNAEVQKLQAEILNPPVEGVRDIHLSENGFPLKTGREIKKRLDEVLNRS